MRYERCDGLMVTNHYLDDVEESGHWLQTWRCTSCGNVVDNTIRAHHTAGTPRVHRPHCLGKFTVAYNMR